jgi:hypothetical protein
MSGAVKRSVSFVVILCGFCLVALYAIEFYLTCFSVESARLRDWAAKHYDLRTKEEVLNDLRTQGKSPTLSLIPKFLLEEQYNHLSPFPLGGIAGKTTVLCNESGTWSIYDSDEYGFNNPKGMYTAGADALLIGESFVQGSCISETHTIAAQMRAVYPHTLSLGMEGNGEVLTLALLMEYGPFLKPKKVIWVYAENTLGRANAELRNPTLNDYFSQETYQQDLLHKQPNIDTFWEQYLNKKLQNHTPEKQVAGFDLEHFLGLHYTRKYYGAMSYLAQQIADKGDEAANKTRLKTILLKAKKLTQQWGGEFYFVYLATPYAGKPKSASDHDKIIATVKDLDIHVIDSYQTMTSKTPQEINAYNGMGHYNDHGYQLFTEFLLQNIK